MLETQSQIRWHRAQEVEAAYWDRVCEDEVEFLRILYEKVKCLQVLKHTVPEIFMVDPLRPRRAVEIGVGSLGIGLVSFLSPRERWILTGVEPQARREPRLSAALMAVYREIQNIHLDYVQTVGESTGLDADYYDVAFCYNVIDHTENWRAILNEVHRILKPGGLFVLSVDTLCTLNKLRWRYWQQWVRRHDQYIIAHPYRFTAYELEQLLPEHGFHSRWMEKDPKEWVRRIGGKARRLTSVGVKP